MREPESCSPEIQSLPGESVEGCLQRESQEGPSETAESVRESCSVGTQRVPLYVPTECRSYVAESALCCTTRVTYHGHGETGAHSSQSHGHCNGREHQQAAPEDPLALELVDPLIH